MSEKQSSSRKKSTARSGQTRKPSQPTQESAPQDLKQALQESEQKQRAALVEIEKLREERQSVEKELAELQTRFEEAQKDLEREWQTRIDLEQALVNAGHAAEDLEAEREISALAGRGIEEKRVSFIVRLTVNERGDPLRTEIEHAQTRTKKIIPAFEPQQVADFIQSCIIAVKEPEAEAEPPVKRKAGEQVKEGIQLVLSQVKVWRPGNPGRMALNISAGEMPFAQIDFQLEGTDSPALTEKRLVYEVKLYAKEISSEKSRLLGEQKGELAAGITSYRSQLRIRRLEPGIYRLMATVDIPEIPGLVSYQEGHFVRVAQPTQGERSTVPA